MLVCAPVLRLAQLLSDRGILRRVLPALSARLLVLIAAARLRRRGLLLLQRRCQLLLCLQQCGVLLQPCDSSLLVWNPLNQQATIHAIIQAIIVSMANPTIPRQARVITL